MEKTKAKLPASKPASTPARQLASLASNHTRMHTGKNRARKARQQRVAAQQYDDSKYKRCKHIREWHRHQQRKRHGKQQESKPLVQASAATCPMTQETVATYF